MTRKSFLAFLIVTLTIIFTSLAANAQQTRAVPPNDNIADAKELKPGKNYKTPDIGAATNEIDEPIASCYGMGGSSIPNSVWFTLTLPEAALVSLSTFGSTFIHDQYNSIDTVLAVYELTAPDSYTEIECVDNANGSQSAQLIFEVDAGATYYIAAGSHNDADFLPVSMLKLSTRVLTTQIPLLNADFEDPITDPGWKVKNGDDDEIVCTDATYEAFSGDCAFRFTATAGTNTKLIQKVTFPTTFKARKNAIINANFFVEVLDTAALAGNTKVKLTVFYADGTPKTVRTLNLAGLTAPGNYQGIPIFDQLTSAKVSEVKFQTNFKEESGTLMLDGVSLFYLADPATRGASLLPVPPAAN